MDQELNKAIKIVEDRGGFVMLPENESEERDMRKVTHAMELQKDEKEQAEIDESKMDFESRKRSAFREMNREFYDTKKTFLTTMTDLEDILLENGIDMDYLEEWLESQV